MKLYNLIGVLAYPPILDVFIILIFVLFSPIGLGGISRLSAIGISLIFISVIPFVPFPYYFKRGDIDMNVTDRKKRTIFYIIALASYGIGAILFYRFNSPVMFYLTLSFAFIALAVMLINFFWKISTHAAGIAGPVMAIAYVFGWQFIILQVFTVIVMWSRIKLNVHTKMQVLAGAAISIVITLSIFLSFLPL